MTLDIVILAAGKGTRMKSSRPKVLHELAGKPLLQHVIDTSLALNPDNIYIICGYQSELVQENCKIIFKDNPTLKFIQQSEQLGTAHAVMQVLPHWQKDKKNSENIENKKVLILYGDVPLIQSGTLAKLISALESSPSAELGMIVANFADPTGFGRIIRDNQNKIIRIVEEKEATDQERKITEINTGIYLVNANFLIRGLSDIKPHNTQKEYYLTDIVTPESKIIDITVEEPREVYGVNDLEQLYQLECYYQENLAKKFRLSGVAVSQNVIFEGNVEIGAGSKIGPNCVLKNVHIGENVEIKANCVIEEAVIQADCKVGPFARIRPGTELSSGVTVGNFTEIKNSKINQRSKIPHLSYIGDTVMGEKVNIGAGVITCNYDGVNKHKTVIGDNVFIGSDSQLIAPINIGSGAFIGAGSTITKDPPENKLTLSRAKQVTLERWERPKN